jgi:hypothetical protein
MNESNPTGKLRRLSCALVALVPVVSTGACSTVYLDPIGEPAAVHYALDAVPNGSVDKVDLLFVIDNSRSMADKQELLQLAIPALVRSLVNPRCVDDAGHLVAKQPASPLDPCPLGSTRAFQPVLDMHVGVISASLGGHGADACDAASEPSANDAAHLLSRASTGTDDTVPTFGGLGFLSWDPVGKYGGDQDPEALIAKLTQIVGGVGEVGCGYEAPLEAWHRFLVDPDPYEKIEVVDGQAVKVGLDEELLAERKSFLRPDSLLAIVMLSDESDCSIRDEGHAFLAAQIYEPGTNDPFHLPKPRAACAIDPSSPCCRSCGEDPGPGCDTSADDCSGPLDSLQDSINLRCFDQKRRFGVDFLQPTTRYVQALTAPMVPDRNGELVPNPIFSDLRDPGAGPVTVRDPGLVLLAGLVGVPWQDIARKDAGGLPDLVAGLDADGYPTGGFQSASELASNGTWDVILGDPDHYHTDPSARPTDPHMIESIVPRAGLPPPGSAPMTDPINGHELLIPQQDDLQFACIFPLATARDCSDPSEVACDCSDPENTNSSPLCSTEVPTDQLYAKAYPGIRELRVLRELGSQAVVGSVCPAQRLEDEERDFGYEPMVASTVERVTGALVGRCLVLGSAPAVAADGSLPSCTVVEAKVANEGCSCTGSRRSLDAAVHDAVAAHLFASGLLGPRCFCEIPQASGTGLAACQYDLEPAPMVAGEPAAGWCYLDASGWPTVGNPALVSHCPAGVKRTIRFLGDAAPDPGASVLLACAER